MRLRPSSRLMDEIVAYCREKFVSTGGYGTLRAFPALRRRAWRAPLRRLHPRRFARLLLVVRRPRRIALPLTLLPRRQFQQRIERARRVVDAGVAIANRREPRRHRGQREVGGVAVVDL